MKEFYTGTNFRKKSLTLIVRANQIIEQYQEAGYRMSLRQLFYQLVGRNIIPNTYKSYKNFGALLTNARNAGLTDWAAIEDRTRPRLINAHWKSPEIGVESLSKQFRINLWEKQDYFVEVWVEKEALSGVIEPICNRLDVGYVACKGYMSTSAMYKAGQRFAEASMNGKLLKIIHLGDHDPSGLHMTDDVYERIEMYAETTIEVDRIALNYDQIEEYDPPPQYAKMKDSRAPTYIARFGEYSWELDALPPDVLDDLVTDAVTYYIDEGQMEKDKKKQEAYKKQLHEIADNWEFVQDHLSEEE